MARTNPASGGAGALVAERAAGSGGELHEVYFRLRQGILDGLLVPGEILNQVHIASRYGVSRTPVREALRLLQAEGLVEAEFQRRMRVTPVTATEVDAVYGMWIVQQSLAIAVTVPRLTAVEIGRIRAALRDMNNHSPLRAGERGAWEPRHREFHRRLVAHAGPVIGAALDNCWSRSERARRLYMRAGPQSLARLGA